LSYLSHHYSSGSQDTLYGPLLEPSFSPHSAT
jgi:hypothetical protein